MEGDSIRVSEVRKGDLVGHGGGWSKVEVATDNGTWVHLELEGGHKVRLRSNSRILRKR